MNADTWIAIGNLLAGFVLLVVGGELLVRGATSLALALCISPLVVGLTVVAFGTSAPELAVSASAAWKGNVDVATGNVLGSDIFNVLFVLGTSAITATLLVNRQLATQDLPLMIGSCGLVWLACIDGQITRTEGIAGVILLITWTGWLVYHSRKSGYLKAKVLIAERESNPKALDVANEQPTSKTMRWGTALVVAIAGLLLLMSGANRMVAGAVTIAQMMGVTELVIGLTVVAIGTSLPEVVASLMATLRGERDLAAGNIVGSNVFNNLGVLGGAAICAPNSIPISSQTLLVDVPVMFLSSLVCLPMFLTGRITRLQGAALLTLFTLYVTYLILSQSGHEGTDRFAFLSAYRIGPLTVLVILATSFLRGKANESVSRNVE